MHNINNYSKHNLEMKSLSLTPFAKKINLYTLVFDYLIPPKIITYNNTELFYNK